jgi:thymidine phosphorylase
VRGLDALLLGRRPAPLEAALHRLVAATLLTGLTALSQGQLASYADLKKNYSNNSTTINKLRDGSAMDVWRAMIAAQGGDPDATLPMARETSQVLAETDGVLAELDAYAVGIAAWRLGAGRARKEDPVQAGAGVELHAKPGDTVRAGQPLLTLHTDTPERFERALEALTGAFTIGDRVPERAGVVLDRIS